MFVVCGEALMDVFAGGDTPTGIALDARVGGSPYNLAVGLVRLGQPAAFFGALSRGHLGERLIRGLRDEGVQTASVTRVDAPTTLGLVELDAQGVPSYAFYGNGGADRQLEIGALGLLPTQIRAVHLGSYAMVVEPIAGTLRALVEREHSGTPICYDPNVRLNVEPDLARWRDTLQWMLSRAHLLKISEEDLALLLPRVGLQQFAEGALAQGARLVVVTRGASGALAWAGACVGECAGGHGAGGRHGRGWRHLPGGPADLAGRTQLSVDRSAGRAAGSAIARSAAVRSPRRRHHLLAPRRGPAAAQRTRPLTSVPFAPIWSADDATLGAAQRWRRRHCRWSESEREVSSHP